MLLNKKSKNFEYIVETFNSMSQVFDTLEKRYSNFSSDNKYSKSFSGVTSFEELKQLALYGWSNHVDRVIKEIAKVDKSKLREIQKTMFQEGVEGFLPIVPNALRGLPNSMITTKIAKKKSKVVEVVLDVTYPARIPTEEIIDYYSKVFAYLIHLEKSGFRVKIKAVMVFANQDYRKSHLFELVLKNEYQPIDMKKLMFPIIHSGMLRALGFEWYERLPNAEQVDGYGKALQFWSSQEKAEEVKTTLGLNRKNIFFIHYDSNFRNILKGVS